MNCFGIKSAFQLDVRRILSRRISGNVVTFLLETFLQPVLVAIVVGIAFIGRDDPMEQRESFVYFSTLYAFWIGLFGSCQTFNSEIKNGEWSYWILGMDRSPAMHLLASCFANLLLAVLQAGIFLASFFCFRLLSWIGFLSIGRIYANFIDIFLPLSSGDGSELFLMQGLMRCILDSFQRVPYAGIYCAFVFGTALVTAVLSGVGFGLLFSASFKDTAASLNASVGFVVILGIISFVGLRGTVHGRELSDLKRRFSPRIFEIERPFGEARCESRGVDVLVFCSRFLPQRYFYNIGTIPFRRSIVTWKLENGETMNDYMAVADRYIPCRTPPKWLDLARNDESLSLYANDSRVALLEFSDEAMRRELLECDSAGETWPQDMTALVARQRTVESGYLERLRFHSALKATFRAISLEAAFLIAIFLACILGTAILLQKKDIYHALR